MKHFKREWFLLVDVRRRITTVYLAISWCSILYELRGTNSGMRIAIVSINCTIVGIENYILSMNDSEKESRGEYMYDPF